MVYMLDYVFVCFQVDWWMSIGWIAVVGDENCAADLLCLRQLEGLF